ncbi:MAG TPA: DedA family protein [Bacteroidales bacterium]|nr:DedA family protein [Bacteroidales bacterium]HQG52524.1 DedA family protein [Bacteroidales bacterium]
MGIVQSVISWYMSHLNYFTVALLMTIESSLIPFPSEVIIPFAAYKAAQGQLNVYFVILSGTAGALVGAFVNYFLGLWLGRPLIYKFAGSTVGRMLLLSEAKVKHAEDYFIKNGKSSTFVGRLVPGVRQLISIPAGLAKMNLRDFVIYTSFGAGIWNIILAVVGYFLYDIRDKIFPYIGDILIALGVAFVGYLIIKAIREKKKLPKTTSNL